MMNIISVFLISSPESVHATRSAVPLMLFFSVPRRHNHRHQPDEVMEILDWISATKDIEKESFTDWDSENLSCS